MPQRLTESLTIVKSNGSKWYGEQPDTIDDLLKVLEEHALDRRFEEYGNFVNRNPEWEHGNPYPGRRMTIIWGNFLNVSHVFDIRTDDEALIARLAAAIRKNQQRPDYKERKSS